MATTILSFLPFITCLFWLLLLPLLKRKTKSLDKMTLFLLSACISSFAVAFVMNNNGESNNASLVFFLIGQFTIPIVFPLSHVYLRSTESDNDISMAWIAIPFSLLFAEIILLLLSGAGAFESFIDKLLCGTGYSAISDKVEQLTYACTVWIFAAIIAVETIIFIIKAVISAIRHEAILQRWNILILFVFTDALLAALIINDWQQCFVTGLLFALISVFLFITAYTSLFEVQQSVTIKMLLDGPQKRLDNSDFIAPDDNSKEEGEEESIISDAPIRNSEDLIQRLKMASTANIDSNDDEDSQAIPSMSPEFEDSLRIRFEDLVVSEQLFLQKGLKISDIATKLSTNRTYISRLVNNTYNMSFSDYINTLRIDYAEQYLIHNKGAKQTDIAIACGFPNASSFNNIFKKITGVTPKIWLATRS